MTRQAARLAVVLALLLVAPNLADARASFAVMVPAARGRGAAQVARATQQALLRQLRKKGVAVVSLSGRQTVALKRSLHRRALLRRQARRLGLDHVIDGLVRRQGRRFVIALRVVAADSGRTVARENLHVRRGQDAQPGDLLASFGEAPRERTTMVSMGVRQSQVSDDENPPR